MSRRDAVLLVSRALAMIQLVTTFIEVTTLPERLVSLNYYTSKIHASAASALDYHFQSLDRIELAFVFARIAGLLVFAFIFWNCAPWVERILLPRRDNEGPSS